MTSDLGFASAFQDQSTGSRKRSMRVLILEDNPLDAELTAETLREPGLEVECLHVSDEQGFRDALLAGVDIILADYALPGFDGLAALEMARMLASETPFIFVSGALGEEKAVETLRNGATDFVLKHRLERLVPTVRRALEEARTRSERRQAEDARERAERERQELFERLERTNAELHAANRAKDDFLALVSHELRSPMTSILGWTQLLQMRGSLDPELDQALGMIQMSAKLQAKLIDDLLDAARIMTGKLTLHREAVDLAVIVREALHLSAPAAEEHGIAITSSIEPSIPFVGDAYRLQQIIGNMLSNSIKFTPPGGRVHVILLRMNGEITLSVDDTGVGISPEFLPLVFDRLSQQQGGVKAGLGLGLSIVKYLVEEHGGSITASSPGTGHGARFEITFPSVEENT